MPLIKCPHCDHSVSTVASICPHCSKLIAEDRWRRGQQGDQMECHRCRAHIVVGSPVCPNCGVISPKPRRSTAWLPLAGAAAAAIAVILLGGLNGLDRGTTISVTGLQPALALADEVPVEVAPTLSSTDIHDAHTRWTRTWVNVRAGRGTDTAVVRVLDPGQPVTVGSKEGAWWSVYVEGHAIGYIANSELLPGPPSPIASGVQ